MFPEAREPAALLKRELVYTSPVLSAGVHVHSIELRNAGTSTGTDHDLYLDGLKVVR